jgi:hypothetical protein
MHFQCNDTYFCNTTTTYKTYGTCIENSDCPTFPCHVSICKPIFEPIPGYCEELVCYFKEKPSAIGNYLAVSLSCGFGLLFLGLFLGFLHKKGLLKVNQLRAIWSNAKMFFKETSDKFKICMVTCCFLKCLNGIGWCLENVQFCGFFMKFLVWILQCLCCCLENVESEETRNLVEEELRNLPMDNSIQSNLHSNNIQQANR